MADTYIAELEAKLETERLRLAACTAAVTYNTEATREPRLTPDHPFYSATYKDVCDAVDREMALRKQLDEVTGVLAELAQWKVQWTPGRARISSPDDTRWLSIEPPVDQERGYQSMTVADWLEYLKPVLAHMRTDAQ